MSKQIWQNLDFINISKIENLPDPISDKEAVNKSYVDNQNIVLDLKITNLDNKIENLSTLEILENTNLYFTNERVKQVKLNELSLPNSDININNKKLINVSIPINDYDSVNKIYVDTEKEVINNKINNLTTIDITENINLYFTDARVRENKLNQLAKPDGSLDLNNNQIINLADPINSQDAITLNYYQQKTPSIGLIIALG